MPKKRGPKRQHDDKIPKAFEHYESNLYSLEEIGKMIEVPAGSVLCLVKRDPRYAAWRAAEDARKAAKDGAK